MIGSAVFGGIVATISYQVAYAGIGVLVLTSVLFVPAHDQAHQGRCYLDGAITTFPEFVAHILLADLAR